LRWAFRRRFGRHRKVAPWTAVLWFVSAASGLAVFLFLFVVFPSNTSTTSLLNVLFR
jgi:putative membrane protein